jgi:hypothetical protein
MSKEMGMESPSQAVATETNDHLAPEAPVAAAHLPDAESQISIDLLGVKEGTEEVIPNRENHSEIIVAVLRILAVMNMVIPRGNDYPLQRFPHQTFEMH